MMPVIEQAMFAVSSSLAASIIAKATIVMALGLIGARLARGSRAAVRHAILAAAFGVLLMLPFASIVTPPVRVPIMAHDRAALPPLDSAMEGIPHSPWTNERPGDTPRSQPSSTLSRSALLTVGWMAGAMLSLLPMLVGLWKIRSLRRTALPWAGGQSIVEGLAREPGIHRHIEVLLHEDSPGPMTCGLTRPAIVLPPDAQTWEVEELNRALLHELEHVRRADWIGQCLVRTVCAVYWFHPLVWMAWRRLTLEAERSCDDAVLSRSEATVYADQLVALARRLSRSAKTPLLAMANRADLAVRVGAVLDDRQPRGRAGAFALALVGAIAALLVITMSPLRLVASAQTAAAATPEFDAVSVKLVDPNTRGFHSHEKDDPGRLSLTASMHSFIVQAYDITPAQLGDEPDWFKTRLYSIEAVTATAASRAQMMLMLRRVLADRFELKLRQEDRDLPVYVLQIAAGGPKFKQLKPGEDPPDPPQSPGVFARSFSSLKDLVDTLNGVTSGRVAADRLIVDRTHLTGDYNIQLTTEIEAPTDDFGRRTVQFPNLFRDIQSQLGLKVVLDRARMAYFVVEHASEPTPN